MTQLHSRGTNTPPYGHLLATDTLIVSSDNAVIVFLLFNIELIHLHIVGSVPCLLAAPVIISKEVLSKAPSVSRNARREISWYLIALSVCVSTL
jgi:hypothetical protein